MIPHIAILTLPTLMVQRKAPCRGVDILNPKEILNRCATGKEILSEKLVAQVVHQLEQKGALKLT